MTTPLNNNDQGNNIYSPWNPFAPTKRDIERTEKLAGKSPVIAGVLAFFFPIAAMIYLNRGINNLKILGYLFVISFSLSMITAVVVKEASDEQIAPLSTALSVGGTIALTAEQIRAVTLARKRLLSN
jgi:hypothetical protein